MAVDALDAWGEEDEFFSRGRDESKAATTRRSGAAQGGGASTRRLLPEILSPACSGTWAERGELPTLRSLCMGFLGRHIDAVVAQLGPRLGPLPSDVKACLLCVARRRGNLTNRVLLSLADDGWNLLDLRGAAGLSERAVRQALMRCPRLRAIDLTGVANVTAALLRDLPSLCPELELLAVGGGKTMEATLLEVLPELLPQMRVREAAQQAVQDSWEDAAAGGRVQLPDPGLPCGLQRLRLLVWPGAPALAHHIIQTVSPRVEISDTLPPPQPPLQRHRSPQAAREEGAFVAGTASNPAVSRKSLGGMISGKESLVASKATGSGGTAGSSSKGTINVLRVRTPGDRNPGSGAGRGTGTGTGPHSPGSEAWRRAIGFGAGNCGGGRYLAPHNRHRRQEPVQQQQQQQEQQQQEQEQEQQQEAAEARRQVLLADAAAVIARADAERRVVIGEAAVGAVVGSGVRNQGSPSRPHTGHQRSMSTQSSVRRKTQRPPTPRQLDDCLACYVSDDAWEGLGEGEVKVEEESHIAEKFRLAYEEQDARLRAKAQREAVQAERQERRRSGAARAVAEWLDAE